MLWDSRFWSVCKWWSRQIIYLASLEIRTMASFGFPCGIYGLLMGLEREGMWKELDSVRGLWKEPHCLREILMLFVISLKKEIAVGCLLLHESFLEVH